MKIIIDENRKFGIEIEFTMPHRAQTLATRLGTVGITCVPESYNHRLRSYWKIVTDGSLNAASGYRALELVSPPLKGRDGLAQLEAVCGVLNELDAKINRSCGLHVHHDAADFDMDAWRTVVKTYVKYEHIIDMLMPPSRRANVNGYCHSLRGTWSGGYTREALWPKIEAANTVWQLCQIFNTRFIKLNLESFNVHNTVEFRQHAGTTNFTKIAAWVALTQGIVTRARAHRLIRLRATDKPFDSLMRSVGATPHVWNYYRERYMENGGELLLAAKMEWND